MLTPTPVGPWGPSVPRHSSLPYARGQSGHQQPEGSPPPEVQVPAIRSQAGGHAHGKGIGVDMHTAIATATMVLQKEK